MKHIVYSIGSTGASTIVAFKSLLNLKESKDYIFRAFDMDFKTKQVGLTENELCLVQEKDFQQRLQTIIDSQGSQKEIYNQVNTIVPLTDPVYVKTRPTTRGSGASKDPSVSSVAGYLNKDLIHNIIERDTSKVAQHTNEAERFAYLILSPCGGTSTGLHLSVLEKLLQKDFTVYLFFLSPSYFMRVQTDNEGLLKANTLATFLRVAFDLSRGQIEYLESLPKTGNIYPFVVESDWENAKYAEFNITTSEPDKDRFCKYVAMTLWSFINHQNENPSRQNWLSSYINDETGIKEKQEFYNTILLYPRIGVLKKSAEELHQMMVKKNSQSAEENLLGLLTRANVSNAQNAIVNNPELVMQVINTAIQNKSIPAGSIREMLNYILEIIQRNKL